MAECTKIKEIIGNIHCSDQCKNCCSADAVKGKFPITTWLPSYRFDCWTMIYSCAQLQRLLHVCITVCDIWFMAMFSICLHCRFKHFQGDIIAGLTVGLTVIPQGLAYAIVAELPPQVPSVLSKAWSRHVFSALKALNEAKMNLINRNWFICVLL